MRSLISIDFRAPEMEPESAHVVKPLLFQMAFFLVKSALKLLK